MKHNCKRLRKPVWIEEKTKKKNIQNILIEYILKGNVMIIHLIVKLMRIIFYTNQSIFS